MISQQPPQSGAPTPMMFRQRLTFVVAALVASQFLYAAMAISMRHGGFKGSLDAQWRKPLTIGLAAVGMLAAVASFPIVNARTKRLSAEAGFAAIAPALLKQFFLGFALSEIAALTGLLIFFLCSDLKTLLFLLWVAATGIVLHFLRVKKVAEHFERTH
jgi:F0F1-type ATP synthase membrane subunit c/vacuolar-type H+-ATPase subunit K